MSRAGKHAGDRSRGRARRWMLAALAASVIGAAGHVAAAEPGSGRDEIRRVLAAGDDPWYDAASDGPDLERLARELEVPEVADRRWVGWLLNGLAILALVTVVAYLLRTWWRSRRRRPTAPPPREPRRPVVFETLDEVDLGVDADAWLAASRAAAERGDYAMAIVCLFNHQLVELDRARAIQLAVGRTNAAYVRELASGPAREPFARSVRTFDAILYGGRRADAALYRSFGADHDALLGALRAPAEPR